MTGWVAESILTRHFRREGPLISLCSEVCHKLCPLSLHSPCPWLSLHGSRFCGCKFPFLQAEFAARKLVPVGFEPKRLIMIHHRLNVPKPRKQRLPLLTGPGASKTRGNTEHGWIIQNGVWWAIEEKKKGLCFSWSLSWPWFKSFPSCSQLLSLYNWKSGWVEERILGSLHPDLLPFKPAQRPVG